ncbi:hypothetical protein E3E11_03180 [Oecophyllibacter saccharovorans]|uniref:hypothetical protein n=1 Tax=Oecophyllibacter saccharovorans TaxID=2558360 RepID=UPI001143287E|nr:hypothetical protein [Oecophyllibacter saccharovorans]QDH15031.1 hypothetical protein E3E11_03180 [Oecophyllibacter saccharovorans]
MASALTCNRTAGEAQRFPSESIIPVSFFRHGNYIRRRGSLTWLGLSGAALGSVLSAAFLVPDAKAASNTPVTAASPGSSGGTSTRPQESSGNAGLKVQNSTKGREPLRPTDASTYPGMQQKARTSGHGRPFISLQNGWPTINLSWLAPKKPLPEQWYAGTMIGYSPAFLEGEGGFEPMSIGNLPVGRFDSHGRQTRGSSMKTFTQDEWFKQALNNRISVVVQPTWGITSGGRTAGGTKVKSSKVQFNDLPVDLNYRFESTYSPSLTAYMGFQAPTGSYSNLSRASEAGGTGTWNLRYGMLLQFVQPFFQREVRFRIWSFARTPVTSARLRNISAYGTGKGFRGSAHPGPYGTNGITMEFGITRAWVFGLDLFNDWSSSTKVHGFYKNDPTKHAPHRTGWSTDYQIGPTLEYSYSPNLSGALELVVTAAGHNTPHIVSPQFGIYYAW